MLHVCKELAFIEDCMPQTLQTKQAAFSKRRLKSFQGTLYCKAPYSAETKKNSTLLSVLYTQRIVWTKSASVTVHIPHCRERERDRERESTVHMMRYTVTRNKRMSSEPACCSWQTSVHSTALQPPQSTQYKYKHAKNETRRYPVAHSCQ